MYEVKRVKWIELCGGSEIKSNKTKTPVKTKPNNTKTLQVATILVTC